MAMTADSASNHHSPRGSGLPADGLTSPEFRRKNLTPPWSQVVRGEPESLSAAHQSPSPSPPPAPQQSVSEPTDNSSPPRAVTISSPPPDNSVSAESSDANNSNAARPKKPAWNKPSNGVVEVGPVMGAVSWPALSESTKPTPKSSLAESTSKTVSGRTVSTNQASVIHPPQKQSSANANPNSNPNRTMPVRQRPKRGGSTSTPASGPTQSGFTRPSQPPPPPPPPPFPVFPIPPTSFGNLMPALPDPSPREPIYRGNNWETRPLGGFVPPSGPVNDHRNSSRRGNYGPRGDSPYHSNFTGRRDQDRGHYGNARDVHMQPQRGPPRAFVRPPPPGAATFVPSQPMRPFANPMGFHEFLYIPPMPMEPPFRGVPGVPFIPPAPHAGMVMPVMEPNLPAMIVHQIDYYFSDANLVKDEFLKSNMDDQGWVSITLIASFPRVKSLTTNIQLILDSLRNSIVVEVQEDKVRRRNDWMKWIPTSSRVLFESGLLSPGESSSDMLAASFQKVSVDEAAKANSHSEDAPGKHSSELTSHSQLSNGEGAGDASATQN